MSFSSPAEGKPTKTSEGGVQSERPDAVPGGDLRVNADQRAAQPSAKAVATSKAKPGPATDSLANRKARTIQGAKPPSPSKIRLVNDKLVAQYGERQPEVRDPLDGLVLIILSQATNDYNCDRAFASLKANFPTWEEVMAAPVAQVADAIRSGGLANQKAARIQELLRAIHADRGNLDLSWMHGASATECEEYLGRFHGVGPKTIACVLVFFLDKPAFPVDTHVFRVIKRLGWIRDKANPEEAHAVMKRVVPPECMLNLHINLIAHGRAICRADGHGGPRCAECSIRPHCAYGKKLRGEALARTAPERRPGAGAATRDPDFFVTIKQKKTLGQEVAEGEG